MKRFYTDVFYTDRVQTFVFCHKDVYFYDPFLIEFLIRTKILSGGDNYIYLTHQITPYATFGIDYTKTMFKCIEDNDKYSIPKILNSAYAEVINSETNIFSTRFETYFQMIYKGINNDIIIFEDEFLNKISNNTLYDNDVLYNIIIKYFNDTTMDEDDIKNISNINYDNNLKLYYTLPCAIFCLERYIKSLMS
jgi:hypothetical protein